ncbi:hypothetical protein ANAPC5_01434 [Anaplasma phagocytophilum]|nr:hypothetical protein ANAPC5_01434 [Anaplasma phagocytophilum]
MQKNVKLDLECHFLKTLRTVDGFLVALHRDHVTCDFDSVLPHWHLSFPAEKECTIADSVQKDIVTRGQLKKGHVYKPHASLFHTKPELVEGNKI